MSDLPQLKKVTTHVLSEEDKKVLMSIYDKDKDGAFSTSEIEDLVKAYNNKKIDNKEALAILKRYDTNDDGIISHLELADLQHHLSLEDTPARYAAYTAGFARAFRYLAFTSDLGEALRPVVSKTLVNSSYAIALGYCVADVAWEAKKLVDRGYVTEHNVPMSLSQCVIERTVFQAVASVAVPFAIIHTTVDVTKRICTKIGRFGRWGPSIAGLSIVPLLPMYLDEPVEHFIEETFAKYGPWKSSHPPAHPKLVTHEEKDGKKHN